MLGLVTSEFLYRRHPEEHEGQLTKTKSLLVSKAILSRRALKMGLGRYVLLSHSEVESGGRQRLSILADAFESVLGAIYLDQGFDTAREFIHKHLLAESDDIVADKRHTNYKSHLQEYVQSTYRTHPVYRIRSEYGPDHSKHFMVEVMVGRRTLGEGRGHNKKEAEQAAARDALDRVQETRRGRGGEDEVLGDERSHRRERDSDRDLAGRDEDSADGRERERGSRSRRRRSERVAVRDEDADAGLTSEGEEPSDTPELDGGSEPRRRRGRRSRGPRERTHESQALPSASESVEEIPPAAGFDLESRDRAVDFDVDDHEAPMGSRAFEAEDDASGPEADAADARADSPRDSGSSSGPRADSPRAASYGRGRRRGSATPVTAPTTPTEEVEHVPLGEAAVDPYEIEDEVVRHAPRAEDDDAPPTPEPVDVADEDGEDLDEESRQSRIDELEQALASFGRRSQKFGRRGRRR